MSHLAVRTLISDTVKSVDDAILFAYARASDFNAIGAKKDKRVRLDPLKQSLSYTDENYNLSKTYRVAMVFYKLDELQGSEEETAKILDETDILSDKFINKLNLFNFSEDSTDEISTQQIEIQSIVKTPVIKVTVDCCTGFILEFDLIAPDNFDYCSLYD